MEKPYVPGKRTEQMKYYKIDPRNPDDKVIREAAAVLEKGGLIVYPTDTLYGLGADAYNRRAVNKLFSVKKRDMRKPVSIMMPDIQLIRETFGIYPESIAGELEAVFPGAVTAVIENRLQKKIPILERHDRPGSYNEKVGVRIPDHLFCNRLSAFFSAPITSTSANISGEKNPYDVKDVIGQLGSTVDMIIDAGPIAPSRGSSIIDFTNTPYLLLREGDLSLEQLQKKLNGEITAVNKPFVITFVCSGNICRSPLAMGILRKMLAKTKYRDLVRVESAGTLPIRPQQAHDLTIEVGDINDINLRGHLSRHINREIVENSNLVFCMARDHLDYLQKKYPAHREKFVLLKQWKCRKKLTIPSIADPIGHNLDFYRETYKTIHGELKRVLPHILSLVRKYAEERGIRV